jgi:hypothetical protein
VAGEAEGPLLKALGWRMRQAIRSYFQSSQRRAAILREAREILLSLNEPVTKTPLWKVMEIMMNLALGHLRAAKRQNDAAKAAREMELRIQAGPRPSYIEAGLN